MFRSGFLFYMESVKMDPKQQPNDMTEMELALYMLQNDVGMVIIQYDDSKVVSYEERPVSDEDEDE